MCGNSDSGMVDLAVMLSFTYIYSGHKELNWLLVINVPVKNHVWKTYGDSTGIGKRKA